MYGYVVPKKSVMNAPEFNLYRAFYCGICKTTGTMFGQLSRFTTNYDITFMSMLLHDILSVDVEFGEETCLGNPFKKRLIVKGNALQSRIVSFNILLAYQNLLDDIADSGKKRFAARSFFKAYKRAADEYPKVDALIKQRLSALSELEKRKAKNIDEVSECFASLLADATKEFLGEKSNAHIVALFYHLGKWIYLMDALDDIDEDFAKSNYNVLLLYFDNYQNRQQFIRQNFEDLSFIFNITVNKIIESFNQMNFTQSYAVLANIVHFGLRAKTEELFASEKKLSRPKI